MSLFVRISSAISSTVPGHTGIGRKLEQVTDVTGPAAEVSSTLVACVIGHVHRTEHMRKIDRIPVGKLKFIQAAQTTRSCRIGSILFGDIAEKFVFSGPQNAVHAPDVYFSTPVRI